VKVLLVDPPCQRFTGFYRYYFPLGLTYIAGVLAEHGHDVRIYDADHDPSITSLTYSQAAASLEGYKQALSNENHFVWKEYAEIVKEFSPDIVGISVLTSKVASALVIAKITRELDPRIIIVGGGDHVTVRPQDVLRSGNMDYVVRGEGEFALMQLLDVIDNKDDLQSVYGLSWRDQRGILQHNAAVTLVHPLDSIPHPRIDALYNLKTYRALDMGLMISERGCPAKCTFCGLHTLWERRVRRHSIERIIAEMEERHKKYDTDYFSFRNGTFTLSRTRVMQLCSALRQSGMDIGWECLTRVDHLDDLLIGEMKNSGCLAVRVGVESGSQGILNYMEKGITVEQIIAAADILRRSGIFWTAYFMLGVPEETERSISETVELMKRIDPPFITLSKFTPLPGTKMYQEIVDADMLNPETTDWAWALNQDVGFFFVKNLDQERMAILMEETMRFVENHNTERASLWKDRRIK